MAQRGNNLFFSDNENFERGTPIGISIIIMLANLPIMLCRSARKRYLLCSTFVPIMLNFFDYAHQNIHNKSKFAYY